MERRSVSRYTSHRPVDLILLGEQDARIEVTLHDLSDGGAQIRSPHVLSPGAAVRLDVDDSMFLGEVVYSIQEGTAYSTGVRFEQCLGRVSDIRRLVSALMGPPPARQPIAF